MKLYLGILFFMVLTGLKAQRQSDLFIVFKPGFSGTVNPGMDRLLAQRNTYSWSSGQKNMPLFCQIENKIEKNSRIPVKIRMGSLNYVNYLENKYNNSYFYPFK